MGSRDFHLQVSLWGKSSPAQQPRKPPQPRGCSSGCCQSGAGTEGCPEPPPPPPNSAFPPSNPAPISPPPFAELFQGGHAHLSILCLLLCSLTMRRHQEERRNCLTRVCLRSYESHRNIWRASPPRLVFGGGELSHASPLLGQLLRKRNRFCRKFGSGCFGQWQALL